MIRMIPNVRYVPELKCNLISLGELDELGYTYKSKNGVLKVTKGSLVKLRGTLRNGLYVLEGTTVSGSAAIALGKGIDMSMLWDKRVKFGRGKHITKGILDYVHSDLWGPKKVPSRESQQKRNLIDEEAFSEESSSNNNLKNYQLTHDRALTVKHAPTRCGYADLVAYALTCVANSIEVEPLTFDEAIVSDS
ncbi:putative mitochondrial protein [Cucumis melo var. makuwa]|uniref:Mitochondrial protein n=1 Tax=Cucumis melo var. makuwa TaxID=1194695 RepID=A0A5A7UBK1_CUCMM|nr:putative mitochondrial protein [Cucumis melo var. makuwa]TYK04393.1 putative mitochondrial protein [Cucumis melo var. makuwa]